MKKLKDLKARFMEDSEFREEYAQIEDEYGGPTSRSFWGQAVSRRASSSRNCALSYVQEYALCARMRAPG